MTSRRHRIIGLGPTDDYLDYIEYATDQLGEAASMRFEMDEVQSPDGVLHGYVYLEQEGRARLTFVDDPDTLVRYVIIEANEDGDVQRIDEALTQLLPIRSFAQLREAAEQNMSEDPSHLVRMALGADTEPDTETLSVLDRALHNKQRDVRIAAIEAASLTQWPECAEPLTYVRDNDPEHDLRDYAEQALDALRTARHDA